jgi:DNA-binding LacI/PurR family transcriptional regulator
MSQTTEQCDRERTVARPKYLEIQNYLLQQVHAGTFAPGQALPKERDLAVSLDVAVGTLRRALRTLEADGIVRRIRGKGTFVNSPQQRQAQIKVNLFSLIVPFLRGDPVPSLTWGFERAAAGIEHQVLIGDSINEVACQEKLIRKAIEHNVAGVAIVPTTFPLTPPEHIRRLQEHHIPVVLCHRVVEGVTAPLVTWPHGDVGRMVGRTLVEHGHRRIDVLLDFDDAFVDAVGVGIRQVLREHGIDASNYRPHYFGKMMRGQAVRDGIRTTLKEMLTGKDRPTAICCFNSLDAEHAYLLAGELGFKIPGDLSLIYFGAARREGALAERVTCVGVEESEVGIQAVKLLEGMAAGRIPHESNKKIEVPLTLLPGETVGPAP